MIWLIMQMWAYLAFAFILGMLAYRWVFGVGAGLSAEDVSAELASIRTRHQESEAERARLRAKLVELSNELDRAKREARSVKADVHVATLEADEVERANVMAARERGRERRARELGLADESDPADDDPEPARSAPQPMPAPPPATSTSGSDPERPPVQPAPAAPPAERITSPSSDSPGAPSASLATATVTRVEPPIASTSTLAPSTAPGVAREGSIVRYGARPSPFMSAADQGAPDDLTRIRGIGRKLEATLNGLGVYYYRQIAAWSDDQIAEVDAHLTFPGRIERDDWRAQARRLLAPRA